MHNTEKTARRLIELFPPDLEYGYYSENQLYKMLGKNFANECMLFFEYKNPRQHDVRLFLQSFEKEVPCSR